MNISLPRIPADQLFKHMADNMQVAVGQGRFNSPVLVSQILAAQGLPFADPDTDVPYAYCSAGVAYFTAMTYYNFNKAAVDHSLRNQKPLSNVEIYKSMMPFLDKYYYLPSASCTVSIEDAKKRGTWLGVDAISNDTTLQKGWLAYYEFSPSDRHVGVVYSDNVTSDGDTWKDVECNTECNGHSGMIAIKLRTYEYLLGFIRTYPEPQTP